MKTILMLGALFWILPHTNTLRPSIAVHKCGASSASIPEYCPWPTSAAPHKRALYPDLSYHNLPFILCVVHVAHVAVLVGSVTTYVYLVLIVGRGYGPP